MSSDLLSRYSKPWLLITSFFAASSFMVQAKIFEEIHSLGINQANGLPVVVQSAPVVVRQTALQSDIIILCTPASKVSLEKEKLSINFVAICCLPHLNKQLNRPL